MEPATGAIIASAIGGGMGLLGGVLGKGKKPQIPTFTPADADEQQRKAIEGNKRVLGDATKLATDTNVYNQEELRRMLKVAIPGYDDMVAKGTSLIGAWMNGELPADVVAQIRRNAAERSGAGGYGGTGMGRNLEARDLGLTSLQLTQQGLSSAERWMAGLKNLSVPQAFDVTSMFLSPSQRLNAAQGNVTGQFNRDLMAANVAAAPDPMMSAIGNVLSQIGGSFFGAGLTGMFSGPSTKNTGSTSGIMPGESAGIPDYYWRSRRSLLAPIFTDSGRI